jgi:hypothetical protein
MVARVLDAQTVVTVSTVIAYSSSFAVEHYYVVMCPIFLFLGGF